MQQLRLSVPITNESFGIFTKYYTIIGWVSVENLKGIASKVPSPDLHEFNSCLNNQKHKSIVENDTKFAFASGFQGTPTFIVREKSS